MAKTKSLTAALKNWNDNVFGNIFKRKRKLLNRLAGIQNCMDRGTNPFLLNLEAGIIKEYEELRDQEATFWHQKSRDQWLKDGDRNTKFCHLTTLIRRRRNKIVGLYDDNDVWTTDCTSMKTIAVNYFSRLFTFEASLDTLFHIPNLFPELEAQKISWTQQPLSRAEVNMAMFSIGGTKTPGPDGYPGIFYQKHWGIYGDEIFQIVNEAFNSGVVPAGLNHTLITLIPKTTCPQRMMYFRPISLCNTIYKVISKVLVDRIRPLLKNLISPNQVSFVPGRQSYDNIMIAQEILQKYKLSKEMMVSWPGKSISPKPIIA